VKATEREIVWVMRLAIFGVGLIATVMAIVIKTVYGLWVFCSDLVYVILFPQLISVLYLNRTNTYGSLAAFFVGLVLRLLGGEALIGVPIILKYPMFDNENGRQLFPFKTFSTLCSIATILLVSYGSRWLFLKGILPKHLDLFRCVVHSPEEAVLSTPVVRSTNELTHVGYLPVSCGEVSARASSVVPLVQTDNYDELKTK
jgi:high affinity choline transporter 7